MERSVANTPPNSIRFDCLRSKQGAPWQNVRVYACDVLLLSSRNEKIKKEWKQRRPTTAIDDCPINILSNLEDKSISIFFFCVFVRVNQTIIWAIIFMNMSGHLYSIRCTFSFQLFKCWSFACTLFRTYDISYLAVMYCMRPKRYFHHWDWIECHEISMKVFNIQHQFYWSFVISFDDLFMQRRAADWKLKTVIQNVCFVVVVVVVCLSEHAKHFERTEEKFKRHTTYTPSIIIMQVHTPNEWRLSKNKKKVKMTKIKRKKINILNWNDFISTGVRTTPHSFLRFFILLFS